MGILRSWTILLVVTGIPAALFCGVAVAELEECEYGCRDTIACFHTGANIGKYDPAKKCSDDMGDVSLPEAGLCSSNELTMSLFICLTNTPVCEGRNPVVVTNCANCTMNSLFPNQGNCGTESP